MKNLSIARLLATRVTWGVCLLCCAPLASPSTAAVITNWTGNVDNLWTESGNWDNGVPASGDTANILGTSGSPFDVDLNGTQNIGGIILNTQWVNFTNGTLNQNGNTTAAFTASDTFFSNSPNAVNANLGNINWTGVTRAGSDSNMQPVNGTQIFLTDVESSSSGKYAFNNVSPQPASAGWHATADNSQVFQYNYANNPNSPNSGSLTLFNGTVWESNQAFSAGTGTGTFTLTIDNSTLQMASTSGGGLVMGPNATLITNNATLELAINKVLDLQMAPANFDGDGLTISKRSNSGSTGNFETLSEDIGPYLDGYEINDGNFSFDRLVLENQFRRILMQDSFDNAPGAGAEALYVDMLDASYQIHQSSTTEGLDLAGLNIYYKTLVGDLANWNVYDSVGGGSIQQVSEFLPVPFIPEPSTFLLAGIGTMVMMQFRQRRTGRR